jgi:hypothetical protein
MTKFQKFCCLPKEVDTEEFREAVKFSLTDENIAKFLYSVGEDKDLLKKWKPHNKKIALASLNDSLLKFGLPNIFEFKHEYPKVSAMLKVEFI